MLLQRMRAANSIPRKKEFNAPSEGRGCTDSKKKKEEVNAPSRKKSMLLSKEEGS